MMGHRTNKTSIRFDDICLKREINWMKTATRQCVGGKMRSGTSGQNGVHSLQASSEHQRWINRAELIPQKWYRWMKWIIFFVITRHDKLCGSGIGPIGPAKLEIIGALFPGMDFLGTSQCQSSFGVTNADAYPRLYGAVSFKISD